MVVTMCGGGSLSEEVPCKVCPGPAGYTHILKTDCYVRLPEILAALRSPSALAAAAAVAGTPHASLAAAVQQQLWKWMGDGIPLHSDGIQVFNTTLAVEQAGSTAGKLLDDEHLMNDCPEW